MIWFVIIEIFGLKLSMGDRRLPLWLIVVPIQGLTNGVSPQVQKITPPPRVVIKECIWPCVFCVSTFYLFSVAKIFCVIHSCFFCHFLFLVGAENVPDYYGGYFFRHERSTFLFICSTTSNLNNIKPQQLQLQKRVQNEKKKQNRRPQPRKH